MSTDKPVRGFLFACTNKSEEECLNKLLFATSRSYGPVVIRIREGDLLFLNNIDTDTLFGVFKAVSDGSLNLDPTAFGGRYPYQVKIESLGETIALPETKKLLKQFGLRRNTPLLGKNLTNLLNIFISTQKNLSLEQDYHSTYRLITEIIQNIGDNKNIIDIEKEIPLIESTTFWDFPKQSYGITPKGNNKYAGVTPALIIYNMVWRYTEPGDLVVDPMCGSGTTIDVCKEEKRRVIGYDVHPTRPDIIQNDARSIPLDADSTDMIFIDSPYGDNIKYNDEEQNIGSISSESEEFYDELEKVMIECQRILKDGKVLGWLIGDQWVKGLFTPVGLKIYERLIQHFEPLDIICVSRRGQSSNTGMWHNRARRFNFYLRGFKYLMIVRKKNQEPAKKRNRKIEWAYYDRASMKNSPSTN